jgi:hypothetical protein
MARLLHPQTWALDLTKAWQSQGLAKGFVTIFFITGLTTLKKKSCAPTGLRFMWNSISNIYPRTCKKNNINIQSFNCNGFDKVHFVHHKRLLSKLIYCSIEHFEMNRRFPYIPHINSLLVASWCTIRKKSHYIWRSPRNSFGRYSIVYNINDYSIIYKTIQSKEDIHKLQEDLTSAAT